MTALSPSPVPPRPAGGGRRRAALLPTCRASNAAVHIKPEDRKYGSLYVGGQGMGKTSAMLRAYLNDIHDPAAAVVLIDPKSELSKLALKLTPPDCGKRVYYLDLARPLFGMSPLTVFGDRPLALEGTGIADNVVAAMMDVNEGQIYQSSRRFLMAATLGALAIAEQAGRPARFEDVYKLLLPKEQGFRMQAHQAAVDIPDLDQMSHFFEKEMPAMLELAGSATIQKLDPSLNKIQGLIGVPPVRRFLGHPSQVPLRQIIEHRDILILDANMASVGVDNSVAVMLFVLRMLHSQLQRQVQWPEETRPRVALHIDEFHYIAGVGSVVDLAATGRAAGLDISAGLQFFAQLGSGSELHAEKIRSGVINLMQSRHLFRVGDPRDAEDATRIAQAVFMSMIKDDPDSRARMGITPEVLLNLPRFHFLASWIVDGARVPRFIARTYPIPAQIPDTWERHHLAWLEEQMGPYPENMLSVEDARPGPGDAAGRGRPPASPSPTAGDPLDAVAITVEDLGAPAPPVPADAVPGAPVATPPAGAPPRPAAAGAIDGQRTIDELLDSGEPVIGPDRLVEMPAARPAWATSRVLSVVGRPRPGQRSLLAEVTRGQPTAALADVAFIDRVNEVGDWEPSRPSKALGAAFRPDGAEGPVDLHKTGELDTQACAAIAMLDRGGLAMAKMVGRYAMPDRADSSRRRMTARLLKDGLIERATIGIRGQGDYRGTLPYVYRLSKFGFEVGRQIVERPAADGRDAKCLIPGHRSKYRAPEGRGTILAHDLKALSWMIELRDVYGEPVVTGDWATPRYSTGRYAVPHVGSGHRRRTLTMSDITLPDERLALTDVTLAKADDGEIVFGEIKPDVRVALHVPGHKPFDLLVEFNHHRDARDNRTKFEAYDVFLAGWCLEHPRVKHTGLRPVVVCVCTERKVMLEMAKEADQVMRARVGIKGTPVADWYFPGREHLFFALEEDIYYGRADVYGLPGRPPALRDTLTGTSQLVLARGTLLPTEVEQPAGQRRRREDTASRPARARRAKGEPADAAAGEPVTASGGLPPGAPGEPEPVDVAFTETTAADERDVEPAARASDPRPGPPQEAEGGDGGGEEYPAAAAGYEDLDAIIERFGEDLDDDTDLASLD